ncbi:THAP-type domain-containing protein [Aphis craccivora]|uniref:THAP-type domain-containing protein n=1 Tax=Aphis craccivora TaxID=307492 RepID=A0A6G0YSU9_APHCR|nr:THAP-type domain-containing protein [Aphis craccivora]
MLHQPIVNLVWSELGISGNKNELTNSFVHPLDPNRKVFMFSDAPHLIKNVSPDGKYIRWSYYQNVYDNDCKRYSDFLTRVYPRITLKHFDVDRFSKMNVKLATQFFSHSMAREIEFYRVHVKVESLKNSYDTQVLEENLNWLSCWEEQVQNGKISKDEYLTHSTVDGLRQFFYTTRQATGPNEHPSTPTFLQVYKMFSIYSLLKPPKTGNCKVLEPSIHTISINDLHCVVNNDDITQRVKKIENLKEKLDSLITIDVGLDDTFDNSIDFRINR